MNILLLSPWLPWPPFDGARIRIFETLRYLSRRHRVTLLAPLRHAEEAKHISGLNGLCERIITSVLPDHTQSLLRRFSMGLLHGIPLIQSFHYDANLARQVQKLTSQDAYDIIHIEFSLLASYLAAVNPRSRVKTVLSMHNIESIRFARELKFSRQGKRRLLLQMNHLFFKTWEEKSLRRFDGILAVSEPERAWIRRHAPNALVELVPNGVDITYFSAVHQPSTNRSIVFTGLMNHPPNIDAVVWFCDEILPILHRKHPEVRFDIVGDKPDRQVLALARRKGVHVTGQVPDIRPYLSDCLAFVAPLRSGGGTRLKILQAMAMRRPVVSTHLGAEGLEVTPGVNILLGKTSQELALQISSLLADPQLRERLADAGRQLVETTYDWRICLSQLERLYETLVTDQTATPDLRKVTGSLGSIPTRA